MKYTGVNHLAMATGDMDRTILFWRDLLEMRMIAGVGNQDSGIIFLKLLSISSTEMCPSKGVLSAFPCNASSSE